jgi:hypothetical protein
MNWELVNGCELDEFFQQDSGERVFAIPIGEKQNILNWHGWLSPANSWISLWRKMGKVKEFKERIDRQYFHIHMVLQCSMAVYPNSIYLFIESL